jgi:hypothetical protein
MQGINGAVAQVDYVQWTTHSKSRRVVEVISKRVAEHTAARWSLEVKIAGKRLVTNKDVMSYLRAQLVSGALYLSALSQHPRTTFRVIRSDQYGGRFEVIVAQWYEQTSPLLMR